MGQADEAGQEAAGWGGQAADMRIVTNMVSMLEEPY